VSPFNPRESHTDTVESRCDPWNKGKLPGQKPPLKPKEIWAILIRLQLGHRLRDLARFNLAIDSKLRGCDLVGLRVHDLVQGSRVAARAIVMQKKTQRPVQFEITEQTRDAVGARIVGFWVDSIGLDPAAYGTHSMRRTKPTLIYRRDPEPAGRAAPARAHQARKHRSLSRHRGR